MPSVRINDKNHKHLNNIIEQNRVSPCDVPDEARPRCRYFNICAEGFMCKQYQKWGKKAGSAPDPKLERVPVIKLRS